MRVMGVFVFLSYSTPVRTRQDRFIDDLRDDLRSRGLEPRTLGSTDYDADSPLVAIRRVLLETNGLISVAFRRWKIDRSQAKSEPSAETSWTTSPYCHIEATMAFQLGLPVVILAESGVVRDGVLRDGVIGPRVNPFDLNGSTGRYVRSAAWRQTAAKWEHQVRTVLDRKGHPAQWYE